MSWPDTMAADLVYRRWWDTAPELREARRALRAAWREVHRGYLPHRAPKGKHGRRRTRREDRQIARWIMQGRIDVWNAGEDDVFAP